MTSEQKMNCVWSQDNEDSDTWGTNCGHYYIINDGTPDENKMKFCCFCGLPIDQEIWVEEEE